VTLQDIDNLPYDELKGRKQELIKIAQTCDPKELATRFVLARIDAKRRDIRLHDQGIQISDLEEQLRRSQQGAPAA